MLSIYNDFVEDYNNPNITAHDVRRINNLNSKQYRNLRNLAIKNGDIPATRHMNQTTAKFYNKNNDGSYNVQKTINGKKIFVGRFPNETTAKKVVKECINHNWQINEIKPLIDECKVKPKNYTCINGYYIIQKSINGKNVVFATIHQNKVDEDTVKKIVDMFREISWNINYKDEILGLFGL